jgi:sensor histidine kinase YesM
MIFFHSAFWMIFMILSFLFYANFWPIHIALIRSVINGFLYILLSYTNLRILIPKFFSRGKYGPYILLSTLLIGSLAGIRILMREYWFGEPTTIRIEERRYVSEFLIFSSLIFVYLLSIFYQLVENHFIALERNRQIGKQRDEAELKMLKSQVNPHFLFNTLNNLYSLAIIQSSKTPGAIMALSGIMRYLIYETGAPLVTAEKEVKFITDYIRLEQLRIEDAEKVNLVVEQPAPGLLIAPLLFIAFIENAFKHSHIDIDPEGFIQIFLSFRNKEILFTCENSVREDLTGTREGGVGLKNVRSRLELMYAGQYDLEIRQTNLIYTVNLTINI